MKKVLSTALALGLVAGIATSAAAYDKFEVSGYYKLQGFYATNVDAGVGVDLEVAGSPDEQNSAFWQQDMRLYPNLTINDKSRMKAEIRLMDTDIWGTTDTNSGPSTGRMADINKLYVEYDSPVGMVRIGRIPFGTYGHTAFNNSASRKDGIVWATNFLPKPMKLTLVTAKSTEADAGFNDNSDNDNDWYSVHFDYKQDALMAGTRLVLQDNQTTPGTSYNDWMIQGYGKMDVGNLWFGGEFTHKFGEMDFENPATADMDDDSWALLLQAGGKFDALSATLSYWWISGDNNADNDDESFGDAGNDWQPLLIMTHEHMELLNNKNGGNAYNAVVQAAGANVIMAQFGMPVSDKMSLSSALAYGWADEEAAGWEDDYGYEIDLGMSYKLLDNLTYGLNFGYFAAGDFFTKAGTAADVTLEDDVVLVHHSLNMTF